MPPSTASAWSDWVEEIRGKLAGLLLDVVRADAQAAGESRGRDQYRFLSPLRQEDTASFYVYADQDRWWDYGTQDGGDPFAYVMKRDLCDFKAAANWLAARVGLDQWEDRRAPGSVSAEDARALLEGWNLDLHARRVFGNLTRLVQLCHDALPSKIRKHLNARGIDDETILIERIGYVPSCFSEVARERFPELTTDDLLETGMFVRVGADLKPAMSDRILFPYWKDGLCVYTIGRQYLAGFPEKNLKIEDYDRGKYKKHLTRSERFPYVSEVIQNDVLWGEQCEPRISKSDSLLVIEGITDAEIAVQVGLKPVISPVTTRPSNKQRERFVQLGKRAKEMVIINDNDETADGSEPGKEGAIRSGILAWQEGVRVRIATLPRPAGSSKIDVCELIGGWLANGVSYSDAREKFASEVVEPAKLLPEFLATELPNSAGPMEIEKTLDDLGALSARLSPLERNDLLDRFLSKFPRVKKADARKVFTDSVRVASIKLKQDEKKAAVEKAVKAQGNAPKLKLRATFAQDIGTIDKVFTGGETETIATFALDPLYLVENPDGPKSIACRVSGAGNETLVEEWIVPPRAWTSKKDFLRAFPSHRMQFVGSDDDVQGVLAMLTRDARALELQTVRATAVIGVHGTGEGARFVTPAGTMSADGWVEEPDLRFVPDGGSSLANKLPKRITVSVDDAHGFAQEVLGELPSLYEPHVAWTLVSWCTAALFREALMRRGHSGFPICQVFGSPGSGKTAFCTNLLWRVFAGVEGYEPLSATTTPFALFKDLSSTNAIPLVFDEYKTADMGRHVDTFRRTLRRSYAGETESRGKSDQGMNTWTFSAPVLILGEERLEHDQALIERTLYAPTTPKFIAENADVREKFRATIQRPIHKIAPFVWRWRLRFEKEIDEVLSQAEREVSGALEYFPPPPSRVQLTLVQARFGQLAYAQLAHSAGSFIAAPDAYTMVSRWRADVFGEDPLDEGFDVLPPPPGLPETNRSGEESSRSSQPPARARDALDAFIADAAILAQTGQIQEDVHFTWINQNDGSPTLPIRRDYLFLHVKSIEAVREIWRRSRGTPNNSPGANAISRLATENNSRNGYVHSIGHRAHLRDGTLARGILINPSKINGQVDAFPKKNVRSWGRIRWDVGDIGDN